MRRRLALLTGAILVLAPVTAVAATWTNVASRTSYGGSNIYESYTHNYNAPVPSLRLRAVTGPYNGAGYRNGVAGYTTGCLNASGQEIDRSVQWSPVKGTTFLSIHTGVTNPSACNVTFWVGPKITAGKLTITLQRH